MRTWLTTAAVLMIGTTAQAQLRADNLALIVNKQQPEGRRLAEHYAAMRGIPSDRIIEIDVPDVTGITSDVYQSQIAAPIRAQLRNTDLQDKVTSLVTFYGVPLRVNAPPRTQAQDAEIRFQLDPLLKNTRQIARQATTGLEGFAKRLDPQFAPRPETDFESVIGRAQTAEVRVRQALAKLPADRRAELLKEFDRLLKAFRQMPADGSLSAAKPTTMPTEEEMLALAERSDDANARRRIREIAYHTTDVLAFLRIIELQKQSIITDGTEASVDSELACLWWPTYSRDSWRSHGFHWQARQRADQKLPLPLLNARIDGPTPDIARRIIDHSIAIEQEGLQGQIVLDARGVDPRGGADGYGIYDQSIRDLHTLFQDAKLSNVLFDNREPLLPNLSANNAAIYCGWYQVRKYAPTVQFVPGAIAMHVASLEMIQLRPEGETGWCRGQLIDGAAVTIGAVGEPFLHAFPRADEFFSLLATGELTLAETYWSTNSLASWKIVLIGDPLYRPFATKPLLTPDQVPQRLRQVLPN
jgi:uncharacterized protein (TIGR03790 family)